MKLSIREKKVLYDFACPNHHNTVTRLKCREMRQKEHSEPEELTETAQAVEVGFSGQEYRGRQALCAGYRGAAPCWGQGARPIGGLRAAAPSGQG